MIKGMRSNGEERVGKGLILKRKRLEAAPDLSRKGKGANFQFKTVIL